MFSYFYLFVFSCFHLFMSIHARLSSAHSVDYFGERALMYDEPRAATILAGGGAGSGVSGTEEAGGCKCIVLDKLMFLELLGWAGRQVYVYAGG